MQSGIDKYNSKLHCHSCFSAHGITLSPTPPTHTYIYYGNFNINSQDYCCPRSIPLGRSGAELHQSCVISSGSGGAGIWGDWCWNRGDWVGQYCSRNNLDMSKCWSRNNLDWSDDRRVLVFFVFLSNFSIWS